MPISDANFNSFSMFSSYEFAGMKIRSDFKATITEEDWLPSASIGQFPW